MSLRLQIVRFAAAGICAVGLASCGGSSKTPSSTQGTTGKSSARPVFAQSVVLERRSGTVLIRQPSAAGFVRLRNVRQVQLGTVIDVRAGLVRLTAASTAAGKFSVAEFHEGEFEVHQSSLGDGVVDLKVQDTKGERTTCTPTNGSGQSSTRLLGLLLGTGTGTFRTEGDHAAASVIGTDWGVRNRCDGTLTVVRRGTVVVTDFRLHKDVTVHAGQSYLAKAA